MTGFTTPGTFRQSNEAGILSVKTALIFTFEDIDRCSAAFLSKPLNFWSISSGV